MKIRTRLLIGFSALMAILLVLTIVSFNTTSSMRTEIDELYNDRYMKTRYTSGVRADVNNMATQIATAITNPNSNSTEVLTQRIEELKSNAATQLGEVSERATEAEERRLVDQVVVNLREYTSYTDRLLALLESGEYAAATNLRTNTGTVAQQEVLDILTELNNYQDLLIDDQIQEANNEMNRSIQLLTVLLVTGLLVALGVILWVIPSITKGLNTVSMMIQSFGKGRFRTIKRIQVKSKDEIGQIAHVFKDIAKDLEEKQRIEQDYLRAQEDQSWLNANMARITEMLRGINSTHEVAQLFINEFAPILTAKYGAVYLHDENKHPEELRRYGAYAFDDSNTECSRSFKIGEGLIGQCALDKKVIELTEAPEGYLSIGSSLGSAKPASILIQPVLFEDEVLGVVEIASFEAFSSLQKALFDQLVNNMGIIINNINRRMRVEELLRESQTLTEELQVQSEELQTQQEELRRSNENLGEQAEELKRSEELLQRQQEELEHFNTELLAKTRALEEQVQQVEEKNEQIEETKRQLEQQAMQLSITSKYKSEFLANMSHELRTPLNSLLILSQLLTENKEGNLSDKQKEYAQTIYMSGADLLKMIDEILDLSKVESGKMDINHEKVSLQDLRNFVQQNFAPVALSKDLKLAFEVKDELPESFITDGHRVKQVLRNLLSNAFKFTSEGSITVSMRQADDSELPHYIDMDVPFLAISVNDTGIGIAPDKKDLIFEAFQQVDGTTSRKYGGTGLGLSISRELARLLGGEIMLDSTEGKGSTFTLYLPLLTDAKLGEQRELPVEQGEAAAAQESRGRYLPQGRSVLNAVQSEAISQIASSTTVINNIKDDRDTIKEGDRVMLIIEDDPKFANILMDMTRARGFKALVALQGDVGLDTAKEYIPDAIILDIQLPVMDGWAVLNELKANLSTRHIPVHVISVIDDIKQGLMMGAIAYLKKPSTREALDNAFSHIESYIDKSLKRLLIVEDDAIQRNAIIELIDHDDVAITAVSTGREALDELRNVKYDCMVLDLMLTDMTGFELLDQVRDNASLNDLPIIIYTGKELDSKEELELRKYAESIIIKDVKSPERLLDETTLFLHRVEANLPEDKRQILQNLYNKETLFEGKRILLVDDDIRNVFALSSVLEGYRMEVTFAENGREALEILERDQGYDLVLMDMMMPEMDGYEAMRRIREMPEFDKLPIIALTAKAMKDDRSKCIEAGASDYVKKPIQTDQLLSLMRVWLYS
ncbi:histidine kinase [Paenibacillus sp. FSL H7-0326]|uniref:response regulator n=1 Tax=Paenibacillus sp. FSL H7-0326 TaxID=1921144 RepID=UPI00096C97B1|nr:response regulator [Paenibacillus sp. FSL H7-0326]OMC64077.1 histidine kinase [Paenibacillus sp. FSL H7-0326]